MPDQLPRHIENDIAAHGVVVLLIRKPKPEPQPTQHLAGWKPTYEGEECPW